MNPQIYPVQKSGNLFIVKAAIGRLDAPPSILQLLIDTGATQTSLPIEFLQDIGCVITAQTPQRPIITGNGTSTFLSLKFSGSIASANGSNNFPSLPCSFPFLATLTASLAWISSPASKPSSISVKARFGFQMSTTPDSISSRCNLPRTRSTSE
jgi:hypothetical protein